MNIIFVSSGKGGVGKSTVACNLSILLSNKYRVGLLDSDLYGPSQHKMLGVQLDTTSKNTQYPTPILAKNIWVLSMASFIDDNKAVAWRGPMVSLMINNMVNNTQWPELDFLVVDMPPGTGDIQIELCRIIPDAKAVIVTTPQPVALLDCIKGIEMFKSENIDIIGIIENMSGYTCTNCGHNVNIFGEGGAEALCKNYNVELLGKVPLDVDIRTGADKGVTKKLDAFQGIADACIRKWNI